MDIIYSFDELPAYYETSEELYSISPSRPFHTQQLARLITEKVFS